jgi:pyrrolysine biosynthesis protein PylC
MKVAIFGGNLQGVEAAYLAKKARWEVILFDKRPVVPAVGLCDRFEQLLVTEGCRPDRLLADIDFILPAFEDKEALRLLDEWGKETKTPVAFDPAAYTLSSSKTASNLFFEQMGLSIPKKNPNGCQTVIAKPDSSSGSRGVRILQGHEAIHGFIQHTNTEKDWVLQEFVQGPSYSVEVIGWPGNYQAFQVTELFMDGQFDCKRVTAPAALEPDIAKEFKRISIAIAEKLNLTGIMDVEVIYSENRLKLLEIDARLPSQTPTVVFWSTGVNMIEILGEMFINSTLTAKHPHTSETPVLYEHIRVDEDTMEVGGEHLMSQAEPLCIHRDFFGADEAISNYRRGKTNWVATMIYSGRSHAALIEKRHTTMKRILNIFNLSRITETEPEIP